MHVGMKKGVGHKKNGTKRQFVLTPLALLSLRTTRMVDRDRNRSSAMHGLPDFRYSAVLGEGQDNAYVVCPGWGGGVIGVRPHFGSCCCCC